MIITLLKAISLARTARFVARRHRLRASPSKPKMRKSFRLESAPSASASPSETTKTSFRAACYTALSMLGLMVIGLAVSVYYATKRVHGVQLSTPWAAVWENYGAHVALLAVFGYAVLAWLFILAWIHAYWPDGWIYQRRMRKRQIQGGGGGIEMGLPEQLVQDAQPMGVSHPMPAHTMNENSRWADDDESIEVYARPR